MLDAGFTAFMHWVAQDPHESAGDFQPRECDSLLFFLFFFELVGCLVGCLVGWWGGLVVTERERECVCMSANECERVSVSEWCICDIRRLC